MSVLPDLKDVFSLKGAFKIASTVGLALAFGYVDLAIWHYMPGAVEFFAATKPYLLENPIAYAVSDAFSAAATAVGGGSAVMAAEMGVGIDEATGGMIFPL